LGSELERTLLSVEAKYCHYTNQYRASSPKNIAYFSKLLDTIDTWDFYPEAWELMLLGVSPEHQRKGIGAMLMEWGMAKATEENIPCALESFPKARGLYRKMGFKETGEIEELKEVLADRETLHIMVWTPEGWRSEAK
jgi:ribosomal protein S18 acetylase RimI-like enzyme